MIAVITAFYVLIIYLIRDFAGVEKFITFLIYNDPALIGYVFIGISIILEKDQEVLPALFVTPLNTHIYLISRIITLSLIGFCCAFLMILTARGTSFHIPHFSVGAFSTCVLFSLMGIFIVSRATEVLHFILRGVPLLILMSLPLLNYFEITDSGILRLFPIQGSLNLMTNSYAETPNFGEIVFGYISNAVWILLIYAVVYRNFLQRIVKI